MTASPQVRAVVEELVIANHILYDQGAVDGYGHISVRSPVNPNSFFLARSVAPSMVGVNDIMEFDLEGRALNNDMRTAYGERFIHSGIYKARADVNAVVHGHASAVLPFGLTGTKLRPVYHMGSFLGAGAPLFEIRAYATPDPNTDMFVSSPELGQGLATALDKEDFVLMRGHGYAATADSIKKVVFRSVYGVQNAIIQAEAMKMGSPVYLTPEEATKAKATIEKTINRPWDLWVERLKQPH
jgi:HCOMODA/2-hydroxy-3-carboxy-muconic semialdehyde decarboxylase